MCPGQGNGLMLLQTAGLELRAGQKENGKITKVSNDPFLPSLFPWTCQLPTTPSTTLLSTLASIMMSSPASSTSLIAPSAFSSEDPPHPLPNFCRSSTGLSPWSPSLLSLHFISEQSHWQTNSTVICMLTTHRSTSLPLLRSNSLGQFL